MLVQQRVGKGLGRAFLQVAPNTNYPLIAWSVAAATQETIHACT